MHKAAVKHPIFASFIVLILLKLSQVLAGLFLNFIDPFFVVNGTMVIQFVAECIFCLIGILAMAIFGYFKVWNNTAHFGRGLVCGGYMIVIAAVSCALVMNSELSAPKALEPAWKIALFAITMFLIGIAEESLFRGIVANLFWDKHAKDPAGVWTATIYSGIIFGLAHFTNFDIKNPSGGVLVQMAAAMALGMAITAIYYRCKNLWVTALLHGFWDFCALLPEGLFGGSIAGVVDSYSPVSAITSSLPFIIVTLVLLRKKKVYQMLAEDAMENGADSIGYIPPQNNSTYSSIHSRDKAIISAILVFGLLFFGSIALSADIQMFKFDSNFADGFGSDEVLDIEHEGVWNGEPVFGEQWQFNVHHSSKYTVSIESDPSHYNTDLVVQIADEDGNIWYEDTFEGYESVRVGIVLDAGTYQLNLVYNYSEVRDNYATYDTSVEIEVPNQ